MADVVLPDWLVFRPRLFPSCKPSRRIGTPTMWAATRGLAERFGMPIAASAAEGSPVTAGDPESFGSDYLDQPVDPYRVDQLVEPGELLETDAVSLRVLPVRRALARTGRPLRGALQGPDCG
jgi:hypothetical protein